MLTKTVVFGRLVVLRLGLGLELGRNELDVGRDGFVAAGRVNGGRFVVALCGGFFVDCGRLTVDGRCVMSVLFSTTTSAKLWKLSCKDSTILLTNKLILSFNSSSSTNCGVEMS